MQKSKGMDGRKTRRPVRSAARSAASHECRALSLSVSFLNTLRGPVARRILGCLENHDHAGILAIDLDPSSYVDVEVFRDDYMAYSLLRKFPFLDVSIDREKVALASFQEAEVACARVNSYIGTACGASSNGVHYDAVILSARKRIAELLGEFSWNHAEEHFSFTGGASTRLPRRKGDAFFKYQGKPEVTPRCLALAISCVKRSPIWTAAMVDQYGFNPRDWFTLVPGNRVTTVPKSAKTDRTIAIEPDMNMYVQKGIGAMIRRRLLRVGINLDDQSLNQRLAYEGSLTGRLATIDLSAASDSISLELVRELVPRDWFEAIEMTRSPFGKLPDGTLAKYQKVSSMGNAFTFELESLLFWAITRSVVSELGLQERRVAVYGDDIIVSVEAVPALIDVLRYCGFSTNTEKSFWDGPFRESCGKHYFLGIDVSPFSVKRRVDNDLRLYWFANSIRRWSARVYGCADSRYKPAWDEVVAHLPTRRFIPDGFGDGALVGCFDEALPSYSRRRGCYTVEVLQEVSETFRPNGPAALLRYFSSTEFGASDRQQLVSRGCVRVMKSTLHVPRWDEGLPWLSFCCNP